MANPLAAAKCREGALLNAVQLLVNPLFMWAPERVAEQIAKKYHCRTLDEAEQIVRWAIQAIAAADVFDGLGEDDELPDDQIPLIE